MRSDHRKRLIYKVLQIAAILIPMAGIPVYAISQSSAFPTSILTSDPSSNDFWLAGGNVLAKILVDEGDFRTVKLCARLFSEDVSRVTGMTPELIHSEKDAASTCVIIGSIDSSRFIKKLIRLGIIDVSGIRGQWESCLTQVVENPFPGISSALVIAGSDRRGTAYGVFELSKQIGVSPWYYFADVPIKKKDRIVIRAGKVILNSPSVKYRGIFINDEMWGLRPWAMYRHAPEDGQGIGPGTYRDIFELMLRLKANLLWPAMHQGTKPFNSYPGNKILADEYGIIMGSSHIEPMLRNNMGGAEWDAEYPGEPWDYAKNRDHIYTYWEKRVKENGRYENIYTLGKRGKDDEAGTEITIPVLEQIFADQRKILKKWVDRDITRIPQVLIAYTEVLDLYNQGLKVPEDVIMCWPDDNFGNIRQLPDPLESNRAGGSGVYYHFQWLNGATTAYPWTCTTPLALTWYEMKKAWDCGAKKLWVVNVGDIKPAEMNIEYFMQLAWDINAWDNKNTSLFPQKWAEREFGAVGSAKVGEIMKKHYELGYGRRPESLVMWNGREQKLSWEWFSLDHYNDEAQTRIDQYEALIAEVDSVYASLPAEARDAFFQTVLYNVKGTALQNLKVLYAQKSNVYGKQKRASASVYAARAQRAEDEIYGLIRHYNRELLVAGDKWDHMASLPGPWGGQWHQWDMPPLSTYSGEGEPALRISPEGGDSAKLPAFSVFNRDRRFIDLFNTGNGAIYWHAEITDPWIMLSESSGVLYDETRVWIEIDWNLAPKGTNVNSSVRFREYADPVFEVKVELFNPLTPEYQEISGYVESNGYVSIEAEHFARRIDSGGRGWQVIDGLGRSGNSVAVIPANAEPVTNLENIKTESPCLEYEVWFFTAGNANLVMHCSPGFPVMRGYGQRVAVSIDDGVPTVLAPVRGSRNVMDNLMIIRGELIIPSPGQHTLKVWFVDPGLIVDKIMIDTGGLMKSYFRPPESLKN